MSDTRKDILYVLKPYKRVERESSDRWWHLKWRCIKRTEETGPNGGTWNFYCMKLYRDWRNFGFRVSQNNFGNYGYSYKCLSLTLFLWWVELNWWIKWDFICVEDGPCDQRERVPLDIPEDLK